MRISLRAAQPVRADVGLLFGHDNVVLTAGLGADDLNRRALSGLYEALWAATAVEELFDLRLDVHRTDGLVVRLRLPAQDAAVIRIR